MGAYSIITYKSQAMEAGQVSNDWWMGKEDVIYIQNIEDYQRGGVWEDGWKGDEDEGVHSLWWALLMYGSFSHYIVHLKVILNCMLTILKLKT